MKASPLRISDSPMNHPSPHDIPQNRVAWWREQELLFVLLIAIPAFCLRLNALPLFGEEPRRALIAREMVESGDWLVPGTQRVFLPSRPPLQNWLIAIAGLAIGSIDIWAARLPSILSTLAVAVMIYGYLRQQNRPLGSMAGALSFLTMLLVLEFGRSAETEAVFTVFVAASLLLWHWGWINRWPAVWMWSVGYGCAALGMLTKGLQAPVYFIGATVLFLLLTGNWRAIITRAHGAGILVFLAVFGAWQIPFTLHRGIADSWAIYFGDVAGRFVDRRWSTFLSHLVTYPCELLFVGLMPWSILLWAFSRRVVREQLGRRRETVMFLTICILFSFVFVWLPPGSKVRYYMPLFPIFATLVGIAVDCLAEGLPERQPSKLWTLFVQFTSNVMIGAAIVVVVVSLAMPTLLISLPLPGACGFAIGAVVLAMIIRRSLARSTEGAMTRAICCIAGFLALVQIGLVITVQQRRCEDIDGQVQQLKHQLPPDSHLVSLGPVHHAFAFFYRQPIPIVPWPVTKLPDGVDYFCLHTYEADPPELPFEWTLLTVVSCDRFKGLPVPKDRVFIGKRVAAGEAEAGGK